MRVFIQILVISGCLTLTHCKSKKDETPLATDIKFTVPKSVPPLPPDLVVDQVPISVYGEWKYAGDNIFYLAKLILKRDGTFSFYDGGCTGSRYTEGSFINNYPNHVLTSFDKFKKMDKLSLDSSFLYFDKKVFQFEGAYLVEENNNALESHSKYFQVKNYPGSP